MSATSIRESWQLRQQLEASLRMRGRLDRQLADRLAATHREVGGTVYRLPARALIRLEKAATRLRDKFGVQAVTVTAAGHDVVVDERGMGSEWTLAAVSAPPVRTDHGVVRGRLDAFGARALLRLMPAAAPVADLGAEPPMCGVCGSRRRRKDSFLVEGADGTLVQVARCCLSATADQVKLADALIKLTLAFEDAEAQAEAGDGPDPELLWPTERYLSFAARAVREFGWVKRTGEVMQGCYMGHNPDSTADRARRWMWASLNDHLTPDGQPEYLLPTAQDTERAKEVIAFVRGQLAPRAATDYERRLVQALAGPWLRSGDLGVAASALPVFERESRKQARRQELSGNGYLGQVGDKLTVPVTVKGAFARRSRFGGMIYKMVDPDGNLLTWFASHAAAHLERDASYQLQVTVKEHEDYSGVPQTIVTRCRVLAQIR